MVEYTRSGGRGGGPWLYGGMSAARVELEEVESASHWALSACAEHSSLLTYFLCFIGQSLLRMWEGGGERGGWEGAGGRVVYGFFFWWERVMASSSSSSSSSSSCCCCRGAVRGAERVNQGSDGCAAARPWDRSFTESSRPAVVHLRWLPRDPFWYCHRNGERDSGRGQSTRMQISLCNRIPLMAPARSTGRLEGGGWGARPYRHSAARRDAGAAECCSMCWHLQPEDWVSTAGRETGPCG